MTYVNDLLENPNYRLVLDHGFVGLIDIMGDDTAICEAARCSYGRGTRSVSDDRSLIRYLMRHHHTSPIEMVEFKFHIKMPIFVMRQHIRHRTANVNEYSGRYSVMTDEMYVPELYRMQKQSESNKQGSGDLMAPKLAEKLQENILKTGKDLYDSYTYLLEQGLSKELARITLPLNTYTELYWKIDLLNLLRYLNLRLDSHAQYEIRVYAQAMYNLIKHHVPITCEAFEDYWRTSTTATLSRMELSIIQQLLLGSKKYDEIKCQSGMSQRELKEFEEKFNLC